jgi:uncharacterized protein (DUF885 family)
MYGDEDLFCMKRFGSSLQISLQQENKSLPDFRKFNWFAYGEGLALYTESLGKELGLSRSISVYFGMLGNEMHRAVRLVVDTAHAKVGREKAIQFSLANEAESEAVLSK